MIADQRNYQMGSGKEGFTRGYKLCLYNKGFRFSFGDVYTRVCNCDTGLLFQRHVFEVYEYRITVCHGGSQESCRWKQGGLNFRIDNLI